MSYEHYQWMFIVGKLLAFTSIPFAVPLFFVKKQRIRKIFLGMATSALMVGFLFQLISMFAPFFSYFRASHFVEQLIWDIQELTIGAFFFAGAAATIASGNFVAKRRGAKYPPKADLVANMKPMLRGFKICSIFFVSLIGIATLIFAREVVIERYWFGKPADLPSANYAKLISFNCESYTITVGPNGELSDREEELSLAELERKLVLKIHDNPRHQGLFMNSQGESYLDEYVVDIIIRLRVDQNCPFEQTQPLLRMLERHKIRTAWFRVTEE